MAKKKDEPVIMHHYKCTGEDGNDYSVDMLRLPEGRAAKYHVRCTTYHLVMKHGKDHHEGVEEIDGFIDLAKANAHFLRKINTRIK